MFAAYSLEKTICCCPGVGHLHPYFKPHRGVFAGADPGTFDWGVQTLVQKGLLNFFVANYFSQRRPPVSQSVNAGRRLRGKLLCEQRQT